MFQFLDRIKANMGFHPRNGASDGYLYDLDGSLRYVRPRTGIDKFPEHDNRGSFAKYGSMNAIYAQFNTEALSLMTAMVPFGPIMSLPPENLQWQITVPGLSKYLPQY